MNKRNSIIGLCLLSVGLLGACSKKVRGVDAAKNGALKEVGSDDLSPAGANADAGSAASSADSVFGVNPDGTLSLPTIYFEYDQTTISNQGRTQLQALAKYLSKETKPKLSIEGHCDERGSNEYNLALGERRAQTVKSYLQRLGVASGRLQVASFGEEKPASTGVGETTWAKNRRAELVVTP